MSWVSSPSPSGCGWCPRWRSARARSRRSRPRPGWTRARSSGRCAGWSAAGLVSRDEGRAAPCTRTGSRTRPGRRRRTSRASRCRPTRRPTRCCGRSPGTGGSPRSRCGAAAAGCCSSTSPRSSSPACATRSSEVNAILRAWYADYAALRRYLVDELLLDRADGLYWRIGGPVALEPPAGAVPAGRRVRPGPRRRPRAAVPAQPQRARGPLDAARRRAGLRRAAGDAVVREVHEETGLDVRVEELLDADAELYRDLPGRRAWEAHSVRFVYRVTVLGGTLGVVEVDGSTDDARWWPVADLPPMTPMAERMLRTGRLTASSPISPWRRAAGGRTPAGRGWSAPRRRTRPGGSRPRPSGGCSSSGHSSAPSARSGNAASRSAAVMWASPNERMPGVSITQPPSGSGSATAEDEVCRPRPTELTSPVARRAVRDQRVDQGRLADPGVPDEHAGPVPAAASRSGPRSPRRAPGRHRRRAQVRVRGQQLVRRGQVGLGQAEQRVEPADVRGDQEAVDQPDPRRRVGQRGDHDQLVGVGHDHPLVRVGVVGAAPQHGPPRLDPDDAGQRVRAAGQVADHRDPVADHDRAAAELARLHGGDPDLADQHRVAAAVDGDDHARARRPRAWGGSGSAAGSRGRGGPGRRPRPAGGRSGGPAGGRRAPSSACGRTGSAWRSGRVRSPSMAVHRSTKSGTVLPVVATFSTSTPSTARPSTAPNIAIRWSS